MATTTLKQRLDASVAKVEADSALLHRVVHGGAQENVQTEGGAVKTVSHAINDIDEAHKFVINLRGQSAELFYPVHFMMNGLSLIELEVFRFFSGDKDASAGVAGLALKFRAVGGAWGGNPIRLDLLFCQQTYRLTAGALGFAGRYSPGIFLRGGYIYNVKTTQANLVKRIFTTQTEYFNLAGTVIRTGPVSEAVVAANVAKLLLSQNSVENWANDTTRRVNFDNLGG